MGSCFNRKATKLKTKNNLNTGGVIASMLRIRKNKIH